MVWVTNKSNYIPGRGLLVRELLDVVDIVDIVDVVDVAEVVDVVEVVGVVDVDVVVIICEALKPGGQSIPFFWSQIILHVP